MISISHWGMFEPPEEESEFMAARRNMPVGIDPLPLWKNPFMSQIIREMDAIEQAAKHGVTLSGMAPNSPYYNPNGYRWQHLDFGPEPK